MDDIELVPVAEAMRLLGLGRTKFYEIAPSLDIVKIGGKTLATKLSIKNYIASLPRGFGPCNALKKAA